jgi:shikimate kinase
MGTGKTCVGKRLAEVLNYGFIDTDVEIERVTGYTVAEIFARYDETRFRSEEALVVKKVAGMHHRVIATGGGVVLNPDNVFYLKQNGILIWLQATPEVILDRVQGDRRRPLLKNKTAGLISSLLEQRSSCYRDGADYQVDTSTLSIDQVVALIISLLARKNK